MSRFLILVYGILSYAVFGAVGLYAMGFLGNLVVENAIDAAPTAPPLTAAAINIGLLTLFAIQHSVMARPAFKRWWTKIVPPAAERSTYVLLSSLALVVLFLFWEPMGGFIWNVENEIARRAILGVYFFGWAMLFYATALIDHFDLFGLRQVWLHFRGKPYTDLDFKTPGLYKNVRHPIYVAWLIIFWATPVMTVAHLLFAVITTLYIVIAIRWEEADLVRHFGETYEKYRAKVPSLIPRFGRKAKSETATQPPKITAAGGV